MSALGRFGRFTLFSPRVSHSKHLPVFCFVLCFGFGGVCCFVGFLFPVLQVFGIPNSPRSLDLDDRQGFIASSAMQQKQKTKKNRQSVEAARWVKRYTTVHEVLVHLGAHTARSVKVNHHQM